MKIIDTAPFLFDVKPRNFQHLAKTYPMYITPVTLLQPWPNQESRLKVVIKPFDITVCYAAFKHNQRL